VNRARERQKRKSGRRPPVIPIVVGAVAVAIAIALIAGQTGSKHSTTTIEQTRPVTVDGAPLARYDSSATNDPGIGQAAPTIKGTDFTGKAHQLGGTGTPTLALFVAHWCPHCRAEVPRVVSWVNAGALPKKVELIAIATGTDSTLPNYPPSAWLATEGWPTDILVDSANSDAATAYGLSAYPYFVALNSDDTVAARASGELTREAFDKVIAAMH
jgi:cytochrome c biogenesis protein CcmG/thiol:disulfide interchange protein DsbE